jgi:hypothetical protein
MVQAYASVPSTEAAEKFMTGSQITSQLLGK